MNPLIVHLIIFVITAGVYLWWVIKKGSEIDENLKGSDGIWQITEAMGAVWIRVVPLLIIAAALFPSIEPSQNWWWFVDTLGVIVIGGKALLLQVKGGKHDDTK